jgi:RNA polymerase sigma-70 factor (ECF subfamily)
MGNADFVTAAFQAHRAELFSFLARTTRDDADAEDLVQEAYLRLARQVRADRPPDQVRAWLYRVASNLAVSRFRRRTVARGFMSQFGSGELGGESCSPEESVIRRERAAAMELALRSLPAKERLAVVRSGEGFSAREIAESISRSEAATRTLVCRARMKLRAALDYEEARP